MSASPTNNCTAKTADNSRQWNRIALLILWLATITIYSNSFNGTFLFDDNQCILECENIRSVSNAANLADYPPPVGLFRRDLIRWSLVLNYAISEYDTWSYHLVNLLVHLAAGSLLYLLVRDTLRWHVPKLSERCVEIGFASALLWMVHPLQTESVTYIIQRLESTASLCYLAVLYCTLRSQHTAHPRRWQLLAGVAMLLGAFSKEIIVTAPIVALLFDRVFLSQSYGEALKKRSLLYVGLALGLLIFASNFWHYQTTYSPPPSEALRPDRIATPLEYLGSQPGVLLHYLKLSFVPSDLCLDYLWPIATDPLEIYGKGAVVLAILALGFFLLWRSPPAGFLIVSFFLILAPTSTIKPLLLAFEHRLYLPLACITTGLSCLAWLIAGRLLGGTSKSSNDELAHNTLARKRLARRLPLVATFACAAVLGVQTFERNRVYRSPLIMWEDVVRVRPENPRAWLNYGVALDDERGETEAAREAIAQAIVMNPKFGSAWRELGSMCFKLGRHQAAIKQYEIYRELVELEDRVLIPEYAEALLYAGRYQDAIDEFQQLEEIPNLGEEAQINFCFKQGIAFSRLNDFENAERHFEQALSLDPISVPALVPYAQACAAAERFEKARNLLDQAMDLAPDNASIPFLTAELELRRERTKEAALLLQESLRRDPTFVPAASTLASMLAENGRPLDAVQVLSAAAKSQQEIETRLQLLSVIISYCQQAEDSELEQYFTAELQRLSAR